MFGKSCRAAVMAAALVSVSDHGIAEEQEETKSAVTADAQIDQTKLGYMLEPLTKAELEVEAQAWQAILQSKEQAIVEQEISEASSQEIVKLREERRQIELRYQAVLKEWEEKGGTIEEYELYLNGLSGIDPTNVTAMMENVKQWAISDTGGIALALRIASFLAILIAAKIVSKLVGRLMSKATSRMKGTSALLRDFLSSTAQKVTFFVGFVMALGALGVDVGPFMAAIGAAGFVIAFALQGTLGNFAAGVMILIYRPFDVGNVVSVAGVTGKVEAMNLVSTTVSTPDNQTIVVPNGTIWGDVITNINGRDTRRVDMVFGIGYEDDVAQAQKILEEVLDSHPLVLAEPAPTIKLHELADSSVNFVVRPWSKTSDYWDVYWDVTRQVKERFDAEGISIPYPQQDVHVHQVAAVS